MSRECVQCWLYYLIKIQYTVKAYYNKRGKGKVRPRTGVEGSEGE